MGWYGSRHRAVTSARERHTLPYGERARTDGERPAPVATVLAVDIGASKLAAAFVDEGGALTGRSVAVTDPVDPSAALAGLVRSMLAAAPEALVAVGVGTIGPMTLGGATISPLNVPAW